MAYHWFSLFYVVYAMYCMINETIPLVTMVWMNETIILIYVTIHNYDKISNCYTCIIPSSSKSMIINMRIFLLSQDEKSNSLVIVFTKMEVNSPFTFTIILNHPNNITQLSFNNVWWSHALNVFLRVNSLLDAHIFMR